MDTQCHAGLSTLHVRNCLDSRYSLGSPLTLRTQPLILPSCSNHITSGSCAFESEVTNDEESYSVYNVVSTINPIHVGANELIMNQCKQLAQCVMHGLVEGARRRGKPKKYDRSQTLQSVRIFY